MQSLLFTGGTGFLGKNVMPILSKSYTITTCGITQDDQIKCNLANDIPVFDNSFDVVLHACGKAHVVPRTPEEEQAFYDVNYQGTVNLCKALENSSLPKAFIFISTVAVYGREEGENISEDHPLNGDTPYAKSKIMAEQFLTEWCNRNNVVLSIIRPSLLAGSNPPGNLGAMINGIKTGKYLNIDHGKAHKSVLMAEDIANLVPKLAQKGGIYNVCDDAHPTFGQLATSIASQLGKKEPISIPKWVAAILAKIGDLMCNKAPINSAKLTKITQSLTFSNEKAKRELNWKPIPVLENFHI